MRFESVTAYVFGRLRGETLQLAPGMNVIFGPNEAGKSTWHAALYVGLCGMRRRRGRSRPDRDFQARHKPWYNEGWEVGATIALKDRRVILRHDLDGRVDSSARDADLAGRDYAAEIMNDGAPDGARWLGLDRNSFLSTACVRQAGILGLLDDPGDLQDELQSAAATARTGETAAEALELLNAYRAENVGTQRAPTKPLVRSQRAVETAQATLELARNAQFEAAQRRRGLEVLDIEVQALESEGTATRAVLAEAAADSAERRLSQVATLAESFPDGEPHHPADDQGLAEQILKALEHWNSAPHPKEPEGPTVKELQGQLADEQLRLAILAEVETLAAERRFALASEISANFPGGAPRRPGEEDELAQEVALALATWDTRPMVSGTTVDELKRQLEEIEPRPTASSRGGLGATIRTILRWLGRLLRFGRAAPGSDDSELAERRHIIEREIDNATRFEGAVNAIRSAALRAQLPDASPDALAESLRRWQQTRSQRMREADMKLEDWDQLQRLLGTDALPQIEGESIRLRNRAVALAGMADSNKLADALASPLGDAEIAALKSRTSEVNHTELQNRLLIRREQDGRYQEDTRRRTEASSELGEAARQIGNGSLTPEEQRLAIQQWLDHRHVTLAENRHKLDGWETLQRLQGERTLTDLEEETGRLRREADSLKAISDPEAMTRAQEQGPSRQHLDALNENLIDARGMRDEARGELTEFEASLPDVADAQEQLDRAAAEFARVRRLDQTLDTTIGFLRTAQERVHRDIAPVLRATVLEHLDQVTGGRYVDCVLSPDSLQVEVADGDGRWRPANLLSHGTAEQLYLLLRLALAQHLTNPSGEVCPLIFDDVVSAADSDRKRRLLDTLFKISESVQVILFTHEDDVRSWAEERLAGDKNHLTVLGEETLTV